MKIPSITYGNGAGPFIKTPTLNGFDVTLAGTSTTTEPIIYFNDGENVNNALNSVIVHGTAHAPAYGYLYIYPPGASNVTLAHGINLSHGNLSTASVNGGTYTLNGTSVVTDSSTWVAGGGRYHVDPYVINGTLNVSNASSVDFLDSPIKGAGTINIDSGSTVDMDRTIAGLHINVNRTGTLVDHNVPEGGISILATIRLAAGGMVDALNATTATSEIFHRATGELDLLDKSGAAIAAPLKFAGASALYTAPDRKGGMDITTVHSAGSLPVIFAH